MGGESEEGSFQCAHRKRKQITRMGRFNIEWARVALFLHMFRGMFLWRAAIKGAGFDWMGQLGGEDCPSGR